MAEEPPRTGVFPGRAPIDAYGNGGFRFAGMSHRGSLLCLSSAIVAWDADGRRLAVNGSLIDPVIQIWDVAAKRKLAMLAGHVQYASGLTFHPDGDILASASWDGTVRLWDLSTARQLMQLPITALPQFSNDGRWLGVAKHGNKHNCWK